MAHFKRLLVYVVMVSINFSCTAQNEIKKLDILIGTWKVENKNTYENWLEQSQGILSGESYKMVGDAKRITETLSIKIEDGKIVYEATVPNQNNGKAIQFVLNESNTELMSFENLQHDFPKKIQYKVIETNKLLVNVLGENDQGFSYMLIKQK